MAEFMELLDSITSALDEAQDVLDYECEYETTYNTYVDVEINSCGTMEYELEGTTTVYLSGKELMGDSVSDALSTIREAVRQLLEQGDPNLLPDGDDDPFELREPWPGSAAAMAHNSTLPNFAQKFDPPIGYAYTGEYRAWKPDDIFLSKDGRVEVAASNGRSGPRHILRELPGTTTQRGVAANIPAAPAREMASSPDPEF